MQNIKQTQLIIKYCKILHKEHSLENPIKQADVFRTMETRTIRAHATPPLTRLWTARMLCKLQEEHKKKQQQSRCRPLTSSRNCLWAEQRIAKNNKIALKQPRNNRDHKNDFAAKNNHKKKKQKQKKMKKSQQQKPQEPSRNFFYGKRSHSNFGPTIASTSLSFSCLLLSSFASLFSLLLFFFCVVSNDGDLQALTLTLFREKKTRPSRAANACVGATTRTTTKATATTIKTAPITRFPAHTKAVPVLLQVLLLFCYFVYQAGAA